MTVVGIAGSSGFFGWHMRARLHAFGWQYLELDCASLERTGLVDEFVEGSDVIVHLASASRMNSLHELGFGNLELSEAVADGRMRTGSRCDVIYADSIMANLSGAFGESKSSAAEILKMSTATTKSRFVHLEFPHLFGEFGVPYYNNGVTAFAHQLATGDISRVADGQLELFHVQDACQLIMDSIKNQGPDRLSAKGIPISSRECFEILSRMAKDCFAGGPISNEPGNAFEVRLFNALYSHLWPSLNSMPFTGGIEQAAFVEVVSARSQLSTSISTTLPGAAFGHRYHLESIERITVISGEAKIRVRRLNSGEIVQLSLSGLAPAFIDIPTLCTYDVKNTGDSELLTIARSHGRPGASNDDIYPLLVTGNNLPA